MHKDILVICTVAQELVQIYNQYLHYLPLSNEETDQSWEDLITQYKPKTIIFGLQTIDDNKLNIWRKLQPEDNLCFIRKGTSLHRVDFTAAEKYNVKIMNTAGVNAAFVAKFIIDLLPAEADESAIGVIGVGDIGKKVVEQVAKTHHKVSLYNRTHYQFTSDNYAYTTNLSDIFKSSQQIAICLPLTEETNGLIKAEHILAAQPNTKIVCISPPRVMHAEAIRALDVREDIHVIFDHVFSGLQFIQDSLMRSNLRPNFIFAEKAAASYECQYAMAEAALTKAQQTIAEIVDLTLV